MSPNQPQKLYAKIIGFAGRKTHQGRARGSVEFVGQEPGWFRRVLKSIFN